jgi:hypothetical protein
MRGHIRPPNHHQRKTMKRPRRKARTGITLADLERNRAALSRENQLRNELQETIGLLYVALATAYGGGDMLDDANAILLSVIRNGLVSEPVRNAIFSLVSSTSPGHVMGAIGIDPEKRAKETAH